MRFINTIIIMIMISTSLLAQQNQGFCKTVESDFNLAIEDLEFAWDDITSFDTYDYIQLGAVLGGTALLFTVDEDIRDFSKRNQSSFMEAFESESNYWGTGINAIALTSTLYLGGHLFNSPKLRETGRMLGEALLISSVPVQLGKMGFGRSRPFMNHGNTKFNWFEYDDKFFSFPSGHSTVAFSFSTILAHQIDRWWAYPIFYTFAASTAYVRIYRDKHWASDVFMGAAIGIYSGYVVVRANDSREEKKKAKSSYTLMPYTNGTEHGLSFVYKF